MNSSVCIWYEASLDFYFDGLPWIVLCVYDTRLVLLKSNGKMLMKWLSERFWRCCSCMFSFREKELLPLCSEQTHSYRFGAIWGWVNDARILILGCTVPLTKKESQKKQPKSKKKIKWNLWKNSNVINGVLNVDVVLCRRVRRVPQRSSWPVPQLRVIERCLYGPHEPSSGQILTYITLLTHAFDDICGCFQMA